MQKEFKDLLASNDVLKQRIETKFKFSKHDTSLEKMIEMIEKEYESNVSKIFITSSTFETKNLKLVKEMGDKVKYFDDEKKAFEAKSLKLKRKYLKKQHLSETFAYQNHEKNESSKQIWKRKGENVSKPFKYSRDEMFSMRKRDESVLKRVKDMRMSPWRKLLLKLILLWMLKLIRMQMFRGEPAELKEVIKVVTTAKLMTEVVTVAAPITVDTIIAISSAARRRKGVVIRDPKETATPSTIQAQIKQDKAYSRELEAELNKNINWDDMIEQVKRKEKEDNAVLRYQALKRKPQTEAQAKKNMMVYLKNMAGFKIDFFKGMSYDDIRPIFEKYFNSNVAFLEKSEKELEEEASRALKRKSESSKEKAAKKQKLDEEVEELKKHLQIIPNDEDDVYTKATPLALKMILLVERRYPLTRFTLDQMLNNVRLEVKEESEVSLELLRFVKEKQEKDKIGSKPDKNGRRVEAGKSLKQLQLKEEEKPKKTKKNDRKRIHEATLRERGEMISAQFKKIRLLEEQYEIFHEEMGDKVKCFDKEKKVFETKSSKLEKVLAQRVKDFDDLTSQNYTSLQKENNYLKTSYHVLKEKFDQVSKRIEKYETYCEKLEKEKNDLKMHYKRLSDSIKQKQVVSQVFTKSILKVNVLENIYTGKSSKSILKKVSQFTTYSLQKDRKYLKKQHSSEIFASQNHENNKISKQIWKRKGENISKPFKYSRDEMFSMCKRDESVLKRVKDVRFPFILKRIFQNEAPSFNNKWKSSSSSRVKTLNETPGFKTMLTPLKSFKTSNETSRFYKSKWTNEKSFKSSLIPRKQFQNKTSGFKSPWNSTSMHQIDAAYIWFSKYGKPVSNVLEWVPKVVV
nr:hypothetical protein [Tanacetum cinerariifolium]